jgi:hypothetical protein
MNLVQISERRLPEHITGASGGINLGMDIL